MQGTLKGWKLRSDEVQEAAEKESLLFLQLSQSFASSHLRNFFFLALYPWPDTLSPKFFRYQSTVTSSPFLNDQAGSKPIRSLARPMSAMEWRISPCRASTNRGSIVLPVIVFNSPRRSSRL